MRSLYLFVTLSLAILAFIARPSVYESRSDDVNEFETALQLAQMIRDLQPWPYRVSVDDPPPADFTNEQWQCYLITAEVLNQADTSTVALALMLYESARHLCQPRDSRAMNEIHPSKPMILTRLMYDLPSSEWRVSPEIPAIQICNGLSYATYDENTAESLSLPVAWDAKRGPSLNASGLQGGGGSGARRMPRPHVVNEVIRKMFDQRQLTDVIDEDHELWQRAVDRGWVIH